MEAYRKKIKKRMALQSVVCAAAAILVLFSRFMSHNIPSGGADVQSYLSFQTGAFIGWTIIMTRTIFVYTRALKNEELLKKQYIKEHDERSQKILTEARSAAYWISMLGLLTATMVSAFYNYTVFFTLAAVLFFISMIGIFTKIFYKKVL